VVEEGSRGGSKLRYLLKGKVGVAQLPKHRANPGNIQFRSYDHGALPSLCSEYFHNFKGRFVSPGGLPFDHNDSARHAGQHQPLRLQAGLVETAVTAAGAYDEGRKPFLIEP